jgi:membrane-associated phospholipid phosphatase
MRRKLFALAVVLSLFLSPKSFAFTWMARSFFAFSASTASLYFDENMYRWTNSWDHTEGPTKTTFHLAERYGGLVAPAVGLFPYPFLSAVTPSENFWLQTSKKTFFSILLYTGIATTLKFSVGRYRPYQGGEPHRFDAFSTNHNSFPSGHTGTAFAFSVSLARSLDSWPATAFLLSAATLTGVARIYQRKHWLSDTVVGASLGTLSAIFVEEQLTQSSIKERESSWLLGPYFDRGSRGARIFVLLN